MSVFSYGNDKNHCFFWGWSYSHLELPPSGHRPQCRVPLAEMMLGPGHPEATTCCIGDPFFVDKSRWNKSKAYTINKCVHIYIYIHSCIQTVYTSGVYTCMCIYIYMYIINIYTYYISQPRSWRVWCNGHLCTSQHLTSTDPQLACRCLMLSSQRDKNQCFFETTKYPLVNVYITMENHNYQWENPLFLWQFSMAMLNYQRVVMFAHWQNDQNADDPNLLLRLDFLLAVSDNFGQKFDW